MLRALTAAGAVTGVEERLGGAASRAGWLRDTRLSPGSSRCVRECESARGFSPVIKAPQSGLKQKRNAYWASAAGPWRGAPRGRS